MPLSHKEHISVSRASKPIAKTPRTATVPTTWQRIRKRFGILELITFISSIILTITVVVLLILLWYMGYTAQSSARRTVVAVLAVRNWLPQFITILTAVLRFSVGAQALICCMMLASLALHNHAISKPDDQHAVVMLQETGPGPSALLFPFARAAIHKRFIGGSLLAALLFLLLTVAQFSSTILLSDFQPANLLGESLTLAVNMSNADLGVDSYVMMAVRPVGYPLFGEQMEGRNNIPSRARSRGLFDTGNTSRAFMPLSDSDRTRVRRYDGFGTVLSTHTICFPLDVSNITIVDLYRQTNLNNPEPKGNESSWNAEFAFRGTFPPPSSELYGSYYGERSFSFDKLSTFNLTGAVADNCDSFAIMGLNVCSLDNFPWDVIPEDGRSYPSTGDIDDPDAEWFIITHVEVGQGSQASDLADIVIGHEPTVRYDAEWTTLRFGNETYWLDFHHSLCVNRVIYARANISMERFPVAATSDNTMNTKTLAEPSVYRRAHPDYTKDDIYDLSSVLHQMGVDSNSAGPGNQDRHQTTDRDILSLISSHPLLENTNRTRPASIKVSDLFHMQPFNNGPATCIYSQEMLRGTPKIYYYNVCPHSGDMADAMSMQLFLNAWSSSSSLATAFEALNTFVFLTLYTPISTRDGAINGDVAKWAEVQFLETRLVPRRWVGLAIVLGILGVHWVIMGVVGKRFASMGRVEAFEEDEVRRMMRLDEVRLPTGGRSGYAGGSNEIRKNSKGGRWEARIE